MREIRIIPLFVSIIGLIIGGAMVGYGLFGESPLIDVFQYMTMSIIVIVTSIFVLLISSGIIGEKNKFKL